MAGELYLVRSQIGVETTYGTAVAATRIAYLDNPRFMDVRAPRPHRFAVGRRDNVLAFTLGPEEAAFQATMPLSASEILEWLLIGLKGAVTPSTPFAGVSLWAFTPTATLDSATIQLNDGAVQRKLAGAYVNRLHFTGGANAPANLEIEVFGTTVTSQTLTGSLTDRLPDFIEGWETKMYIDALGATPGTTAIAGTLLSWDVDIRNNLGRKYTADNVNFMNRAVFGYLDVNATLLFEASAAQSATEFANWSAATPRLIRLEHGQNVIIASTLKKFVTIDLPGSWDAVDLGQGDAGTRAYQFKLQYQYDSTNAFGVQVRAQNARATAW